jgi:hypothetical protein
MRLMVTFLLMTILAPQILAQEQWRRLSGAAQAYSVDVQSLRQEAGVLTARIRTHDVGSRTIVQRVQVRCASNQLRTVDEESYDSDTGRPVPQAIEDRHADGSAWPEYASGSEGYAVLSSLCELARRKGLLGPGAHSLGAA